jgi:dethiobiotin synthetase
MKLSDISRDSLVAQKANLDTLRHEFTRRHQAPCLGVVPRLADPTPATVAAHLDGAALHRLFSA